jgi:hypothetical protein
MTPPSWDLPHEDTPPRDLLISHVPTTGTSHRGCPGHAPRRMTRRPSPHTQDSCQDLPMLLPDYRHQVPQPLTTILHTASHHIYNASRSKQQVVSERLAYQRVCRGKATSRYRLSSNSTMQPITVYLHKVKH